MTGSFGKVDVNIINPFITSIINVFKTMIQIDVERKSLALKKGDKMFGNISAVIGLAGTGSGSVVISFSADFAKTCVAKMLMDDPENLNKDDIRDGIGEIANMVSGSAKSSFSDSKYKFNISLPTVIEGATGETEIVHKRGVACIEVGFESDTGEKFVMEVSLRSNV